MSWPAVKLGELCTVVRGSSPRPKGDPRYYGGEVPRLMVSDVTRDGKFVTPKIDFLTEAGAEKSRPMKKGDFVIAVSGQPGQALMLAIDACIHDGFAGLRNLNETKISKDYLFHFMNSAKERFSATAAGAIFKNLTTEQIRELEIPLPPLAEQKRIAAILDKADDIRRKRQQAIQLADDFLRSVFLDMFGDPVTNPKGWEEQPLHALADIRSGVTKGKKVDIKNSVTLPYMRVANVQDGYLDLSDIKQIVVSKADAKKCLLKHGDLLLTEGGDPDKLGRGYVWDGEIENCLHQNHIFSVRIKVSKPALIRPQFLSAIVSSLRGKRYFLKVGKQTTGIATINKTVLSEFPVLVPSAKLQDEYIAICSKVAAMKDAFAQGDLTLMQSCQQSLFSNGN